MKSRNKWSYGRLLPEDGDEKMKETEEQVPDFSGQGESRVHLPKTGEIELPSFDVSPFIGKRVKIAAVQEFKGTFGYYIKISTEAVHELEVKGKAPVQICGTRLFTLYEDVDGNIGWGKQTKLGVYLSKMKVSHYKELVGKEVQLQSVTSTKDGKDYLTFN